MLRSEGTPAPSVLKDDGYASAGFIVSSSFKGDNKKRRRALGEKQRNGEKHKEGSFEQAPGLSRGRGRAVPTTLPSVKQTDGERERERERAREGDMKVGGGWERWRERSNSAHRSNEHFLSVSQKCS